MKRNLIRLALSGVLIMLLASCSQPHVKVLVYSKTTGYRHESIETGIAAIQKLGKENGFDVFATEDSTYFTEEELKKYAAVIFLNTTQNVLNYVQQADFERYIQAGGGFVGVHAATDTEYDWKWFNQLVGANFESHPAIQQASISMVDKHHPATEKLPENWVRTDEWYNFKNFNSDVKVLLNLEESTYKEGKMGPSHPIAWYHDFDGGRAFYTALGHTKESYSEPLFLKHLLGGIRYAIGYKKKLDYRRATVKRIPAEDRFQVTVLAEDMEEPMEMAIMDDNSVLFIERHGMIKLYEPKTGQVRNVRRMNIFSGLEDGLLGMALDRNFKQNNWIYFLYSHPVDSVQCISRFTWDGYDIDTASEKVLLRIPTQRRECCHSGGCLRMDREGDLWASTGDNTNPFESDGFNPIDERPDRFPWDAQKSSANSKDLRGKIIRIHPETDGTYSIPKGNLFQDSTVGRPEIYVMGCRNPFRHYYDPYRKYLYWGEVGPDSGKDSLGRGPRGYDEFNQAKTAGFFGWPYFIGDNKVYHEYDFTTKTSGKVYDALHPVNNSPNNTGSRELPPAQKAFVWYPYAKSEEFPLLGDGGRTAMAGPVFYKEDFKDAKNHFPDYFEGKPIMYEWMRNFMFAIQLDAKGDYVKMDPFLPNLKLTRPVDMQFSKDGALYILEYGTQWNARNLDARLIRIDYIAGNRNPVAAITSDRVAGSLPMVVQLSADSSYDLDKDMLSFLWEMAGADWKDTTANPKITLGEPGEYDIKLTVKDKNGGIATAHQILQAGNEPPTVTWKIQGNQSFFWDNVPINYEVVVNDREDLTKGGINRSNIAVSFDMLQGFDMVKITQGHQMSAGNKFATGKTLIDASDCKTCHGMDITINGPSFLDISKRYKGVNNATGMLSKKIIRGGGGVWGQREMAAHPQISETDATAMVQYILSLSTAGQTVKSAYPPAGIYRPKAKDGNDLVLSASYIDNGYNSLAPLQGKQYLTLKPATIYASRNDGMSRDLKKEDKNGHLVVTGIKHDTWLKWNAIDLTGIRAVTMAIYAEQGVHEGGIIELRQGGAEGTLVGTGKSMPVSKPTAPVLITIPLQAVSGKQDIFVVFKNPGKPDKLIGVVDWIKFER